MTRMKKKMEKKKKVNKKQNIEIMAIPLTPLVEEAGRELIR